MDKNLFILVNLLAKEAAKAFLQSPELVNSYYLLEKSKRPVLLEQARAISGRKS